MSRFLQRPGRGCAPKLRSASSPKASSKKHRRLEKAKRRNSKPTSPRKFETLEDRWVLSSSPIYSLGQELVMTGDTDQSVEIAHTSTLELDQGTFAVAFNVDDAQQNQTLFSKDHSGYQEGGHLTAWTNDGRIKVRFQTDSRSIYLQSAVDAIQSGEDHHVAVSFGEQGTRLFVDGLIADAEVYFDQTIAMNDNSLYLGASSTSWTSESPYLHTPLSGTIREFTIYDTQLDLSEIAEVAGLDLSPLTQPTMIDGMLHGSERRDVLFVQQHAGEGFDHQVDSSYGNDVVIGTFEDDTIAGGHGEDMIFGGAGNDLLISRSDGREPVLAQEYDASDDPFGLINPDTRTLYADQPIASDDLLIGGAGADTFRFEILINAKENILFKHVEDDGSIDWKGVTGENRYAHDHWVDRIGDEVIWDFDRAEGDKIEILGHTVDVYKVTHVDLDNDGVLDASVMYLQSNQGNAGAHNKDKLGTITVLGDLVRESDYTVHAHANLGIVDNIGQLADALAPRHSSPLVTDGTSRWLPDSVDEAPLPTDAVFAVGQDLLLDADQEEYLNVAHSDAFELAAGTVALSFTVDDAQPFQTLFSKDHSGYQEGGHLTVWTTEGQVKARFQSDTRSVYLYSAEGAIQAGQEHHVAFSFGEEGARLYVDGLIADAEVGFTQDLTLNENSLVIGASTVSREGDRMNLKNFFSGSIGDFTIYDSQLSLAQVAEVAGLDLSPLAQPTVIDGVLYGTERGEELRGQFVDGSYGDDDIFGTDLEDTLAGGHGEDILRGGAGNDLLISRSDGREPVLAQEYDASDDPFGLINPDTRTLYADQPIASDDLLIGGAGADTFRFEILINAKENILFKHVEDDGSIDWKGVTGENRYAHDHWVDRIGDEVIWDFDRAEGDKIEILGHTVDVYKVTHVDLDNDGVLDASVMYLQSNQGNAGAHNKDKLGTITVLGDLVRESDYTVHAHANLGIVDNIGQLADALAPRHSSPLVTDGTSRWLPDSVDEAPLPTNAVFAVGQPLGFADGAKDYVQVQDSDRFDIDNGMISVQFVADHTSGRQALFSKDHSGFQQGGHLTVELVNDRVEVRMQSDSESVYLRSANGLINAGTSHNVQVTFGDNGLQLYVDNVLVDSELDFTQGISPNENDLFLGASSKSRDGDHLNLRDHFEGVIEEFVVYDNQLPTTRVAAVDEAFADINVL